MKENTRNYFFYSFLTILLSVGVFYGFKKVLPDRLFNERTLDAPGVVIDSLALDAIANENTLDIKEDTSANREDSISNGVYIKSTDNIKHVQAKQLSTIK